MKGGALIKQAEVIKKLTDRELLLNLYVTQGILLFIALLLSWWWQGSPLAVFHAISFRLDHVIIGAAFGILVVVVEIFLYWMLPSKWFDDGGINKRVFAGRHPVHIAVLSFVVAFSEEVLFRGILQTQFGIWIASFIFAIIHFRYLSNAFLFLFTVTLSFSLGLLYLYTGNLLSVITAHFIIDFLLGLMLRFQKDTDRSDFTNGE